MRPRLILRSHLLELSKATGAGELVTSLDGTDMRTDRIHLLPQYQAARKLLSPLAEQAKAHWKEYRPRMYAELEKAGTLDEAAQRAVSTERGRRTATRRGRAFSECLTYRKWFVEKIPSCLHEHSAFFRASCRFHLSGSSHVCSGRC